jgi:hypothetical protein
MIQENFHTHCLNLTILYLCSIDCLFYILACCSLRRFQFGARNSSIFSRPLTQFSSQPPNKHHTHTLTQTKKQLPKKILKFTQTPTTKEMNKSSLSIFVLIGVLAILVSVISASTHLDEEFNFDDFIINGNPSHMPSHNVTSSASPGNDHKTLAIVLGIIGGVTFVGLVLIIIGAVVYVFLRQRATYEAI